MKKFFLGKQIESFDYNFNGKICTVIAYHPYVSIDGHVFYNLCDGTRTEYYCAEIGINTSSLEYLLIAWIAHKNLGLNQYALVEGICRALKVEYEDVWH